MKKVFFIFILTLLFSSCVINKRTYYDYSTGLPGYTMPEYDKIDKSLYADYFLESLYFTVNITSTYYTNNTKRTASPYYIRFYAVSKNEKYEKMIISNCKVISNLKGEYTFDWLPAEYSFDEYKIFNNNLYYYSPIDWDHHLIDLDIDNNEIINLSFDLTLIDENNKEYKKKMHYTIKPKIEIKYIETMIESW